MHSYQQRSKVAVYNEPDLPSSCAFSVNYPQPSLKLLEECPFYRQNAGSNPVSLRRYCVRRWHAQRYPTGSKAFDEKTVSFPRWTCPLSKGRFSSYCFPSDPTRKVTSLWPVRSQYYRRLKSISCQSVNCLHSGQREF